MQAKVYFIGAGPGDAELLTLKGHRIISQADLVLYAGSLVPKSSLTAAKSEAKIIDSSSLNLAQCHELMRDTIHAGKMVARVHTGDPSLYGTIAEQARLLEIDKITYEIIPGVTSACAAAAAAKISFTIPEVTQSLIITRMSGRTPMPEKEEVERFASIGCSMAIYLSANHVSKLQEKLSLALPLSTPILCAYRVGWSDEQLYWCTVENLVTTSQKHNLTRQTLFLILPGYDSYEQAKETYSRLYAADFKHGWRP